MGSQKRRSSRVATHDKPITSDKTTVEDGQPPRVGHREESALVLYARDVVRVVPLRPGSPLSIGRSAPSDVVLDDPLLSRQHVQVTLKDGALLVEDLASTNGTYVRGARVTSELVAAGESFQLGSVTASLSVAGSEGLLRGLSSHARLLSRLDDEVLRARAFGRPLAVALIRAAARSETGATHVSRWASRLRAALRPVDGLAIYAPSSMLVILPELDAVRAVEEAQRFTLRTDPSEPTLLAGLAVFPDAASAEELVDLARRAVRAATPSAPVQLLGARTESTDGGRTAIAASPSMREILALTRRLGPSNVPVLILGETGSGKEIIARRLHDESPRREAPLRAINCGAIPSALLPSVLFGHERGAFTGADVRTLGLFEQAHGGTVFLDEVGELSAAAQAALLRVLETKRLTRVGGSEELEVDVRILAATHRDLPEQVARGVFRQDLFYRLNTVTVSVPPLRERTEDIEPMARHFLEEASRNAGSPVRDFDADALARLRAYGWPGNVRELRNVIERAVLVAEGTVLRPVDLGDRVSASGASAGSQAPPSAMAAAIGALDAPTGESLDFRDRIRGIETELILDALKKAQGNQTEAARILRMPLRTLVHKLKSYGIRHEE
jgi:two-component system response regulator AtoC